MTLLRYFSGGKPQSGEDRIGGGLLGLPPDPVLDAGQTFGSLMDIVAVDDVDKGFEQLLEALSAVGERRGSRCVRPTSRCPRHPSHRLGLFHSNAFPRRRIPALAQNHPVAA